MRKWLRRLGIGAGSLVLLLVLAVMGVYGFSSSRFQRTYDAATVKTRPVVVPADPASIARGRHLVFAIGKCVDCHGIDLSGQQMVDDPAFGRLSATNLTSGRGGIGGKYSDEDLARVLQHGVRPDGSALLFMPSQEYTHMNDADLGAVIAYLRSVPAVDKEHAKPRVGPVARMLYLTKKLPLVPAELIDHEMPSPAVIPVAATKEYGRYIARIGGCLGCHSENLAGGVAHGPGTPPAANLTPAAIGDWTLEDFRRALREGTRKDGTKINPAMPFVYTSQMTDTEIEAVWAYLQTVAPVASEATK